MNTEPTSKRSDQLVPGDVVWRDDAVHTVTFVQPAGENVLIVFDDSGTCTAVSHWKWGVPTEAQIIDAKDRDRREGMAAALERLAADIRTHGATPPLHSINVVAVVGTVSELETWAAMLGKPIGRGGSNDDIPVVVAVQPAGKDLVLNVRAQALEEFPGGVS